MPMVPNTEATTAKASREIALREAMREQTQPSHFNEAYPSPRRTATAFVNLDDPSKPFYPPLTNWKIRPCVIGAAWFQGFDFITELRERQAILVALFAELPLHECGWARTAVLKLERVSGTRWRLSRPHQGAA